MTVFEATVIKLTTMAREIARNNTVFNSFTYDGFVQIMREKSNDSMFGLPPEVYVRALKKAYHEFTGRQPVNGEEPTTKK